MARARVEIEAVKPFEVLDAPQGFRLKRAFSVERVQDDAFEQIAQRQIVIFGERFQDFEQALLDANAGLHSLYDEFAMFCHIGTNVP
jgi:hypothetical protein